MTNESNPEDHLNPEENRPAKGKKPQPIQEDFTGFKEKREMIRELGRILISVMLLGLAGFLIYWGIVSPEPAEALGVGAMAGAIIGGIITYWLKP